MNIHIKGNMLQISGVTELTASFANEMKEQVSSRFGSEVCDIDFDASQLQFLDSSGLGVLISMQKRANQRGGKFRLIAPTAPALQILELTRLHRVFEIILS